MLNSVKKFSKNCLCLALILVVALVSIGCNGGGDTGTSDKADSGKITSTQGNAEATPEAGASDNGDSLEATPEISASASGSSSNTVVNVSVLGEGKYSFDFTVTDAEGSDTKFEIHTDKKTVGDALTELDLIDGEEGDYGLYVKTVNGVTVDYDKDGEYWAFYIGGEYAQTGVDATEIKDGESYSFKVQK